MLNKHCSGHDRVTKIDGDQRTPEQISRKKWGQQDSNTARGRQRWQHKTELDGNKWSVAYVPLGVTSDKYRYVSVQKVKEIYHSYTGDDEANIIYV